MKLFLCKFHIYGFGIPIIRKVVRHRFSFKMKSFIKGKSFFILRVRVHPNLFGSVFKDFAYCERKRFIRYSLSPCKLKQLNIKGGAVSVFGINFLIGFAAVFSIVKDGIMVNSGTGRRNKIIPTPHFFSALVKPVRKPDIAHHVAVRPKRP